MTNGKIYGVKKGTLGYYHEYAHKLQHEKWHLASFDLISRFFLYALLFVIIVYLDKFIIKLFFILLLMPEFWIENVAWGYAFRRFYEEKKKKNENQ